MFCMSAQIEEAGPKDITTPSDLERPGRLEPMGGRQSHAVTRTPRNPKEGGTDAVTSAGRICV